MSGAEQQPSSRTMRLVVVGIVLTVLLGVVAFVSRGHVSPAGSGAHDRGASQMLANIVFTLFVLAMVGGTIVILYLHGVRRSKRKEPFRLRPLLMSLIFFAAVLIAMIAATGRLGSDNDARLGNAKQPAKQGKQNSAQKKKLQERLKNPHSPSFNWELAAGLIALIVGASVTAFIRSKRRRSKLIEELTLAHELAQLLDETLDDIRAEADPRRAVIAAYARMEQILSAHGLPRRPSEAPLEYLRRVLADLEVSEQSATKLTALYERAKFSEHEIDPGMKEEAIDALEALRDEVRAISARPEPPPPADFHAADVSVARTYRDIRSRR